MNAVGNGAASEGEPRAGNSRGLGDQGRLIQRDAATLVADVRDAADSLQHFVATQVEERPFTTLGAAAGVGYVLGGGLRSRLTVLLLGAAARVATALIARELGSRVLQSGSAPVRNGDLPGIPGDTEERS